MADMQSCEQGVVLCIIRKTVGYQKQWDEISLSQLMKATGMNRPSVQKGVQLALSRGIIQRRQIKNTFEYCVCDPMPNGSKSEPFLDETVHNVNDIGSENEPIVDKETDGMVQKMNQNGSKNEPIDSAKSEPISTNGSKNEPKSVQKMNSQNKKERTTTFAYAKVIAPNGASPPLEAEPETAEQGEWFAAMCWLRYGHQDYKLLGKTDRLAIGKSIKKIRKSDQGYTIADLRFWYKTIWSQEWPGKQPDKAEIQHPTLKQIETGIGRVKQVKPADMVSANSRQPSYMRLKQL